MTTKTRSWGNSFKNLPGFLLIQQGSVFTVTLLAGLLFFFSDINPQGRDVLYWTIGGVIVAFPYYLGFCQMRPVAFSPLFVGYKRTWIDTTISGVLPMGMMIFAILAAVGKLSMTEFEWVLLSMLSVAGVMDVILVGPVLSKMNQQSTQQQHVNAGPQDP